MMDEFILFMRDALRNSLYQMVIPTFDTMAVDVAITFHGKVYTLCGVSLNEKDAKLEITSYYANEKMANGFFSSLELGDPKFNERLIEIVNEINEAAMNQDVEYHKSSMYDYGELFKTTQPAPGTIWNTPIGGGYSGYIYGGGTSSSTTNTNWANALTSSSSYGNTSSVLGQYTTASANYKISFQDLIDSNED